MINKIFIRKYLPKRSVKELITLFSGEGLVQIIGVVSYFVLPKLYSPNDFGEFAIFNSIISLLLLTMSGNYEAAIVVAPKKKEAKSLLEISQLILFISAFFIASLIGLANVFEFSVSPLIQANGVSFFLVLLLSGQLAILHFWFIRQRDFKKISLYRTTQRAVIFASAILISFLFPGTNGLLHSLLFGSLAALLVLNKGKIKLNKKQWKVEWNELKVLLKSYKNFPLYSVPTSFAYLLSLQVPVFLIGSFFQTKDVGFYSLASSLILLPCTMLGNILYNFYYPNIAKAIQLKELTKEMLYKPLTGIILITSIPCCLAVFFTQDLIQLILGDDWSTTGRMITFLAPLLMIIPATDFLLMTFNAFQKQKWGLFFNILQIFLVSAAFGLSFVFNDLFLGLELFSVALLFLFCLIFIKVKYLFQLHIKEAGLNGAQDLANLRTA